MRMLVNARNQTVAIEGDRIVGEGGKFDIVINCPSADVRPGLINAHDHLHRNHYGRLGHGPYPNAYCWAEDIQLRFSRRIAHGRRLQRRQALLAGAWKNLFSGVTTVIHHDRWEPDFDRDFPIRVAPVECADSLGRTERIEPQGSGSFCIHLAEGIDEVAASEVRALERRGLLNERLIAVHAVGMDLDGIERFRRSGAALVWCPTSNNFLFGRTAPRELLESGCDVMLGSDSRLSGAGDLLDEVRAARSLGILGDARLEAAVCSTPARRLGLREPSLEPGSRADLILLDRPVTEARSDDVALTVASGVPRVARPDIARLLGPLIERGTTMRVGRISRWANQEGRIGS